jgi:hypothetical protein
MDQDEAVVRRYAPGAVAAALRTAFVAAGVGILRGVE